MNHLQNKLTLNLKCCGQVEFGSTAIDLQDRKEI